MLGVSLLVASCASLTGLSDDYRFDLDAAAGGGDASADANADAKSGPSRDGATTCNAIRVSSDISQVTNDITLPCKNCLVTSCCDAIERCIGNSECVDSMKCIFGCTRQQSEQQRKTCIQGCKQAFFTVVGCAQSSCTSINECQF